MSNTNQSSREQNNDNESVNENQHRTKDKYDDDDSIYDDELCLTLISLYVRMQKMVNWIQRNMAVINCCCCCYFVRQSSSIWETKH